jgi:hypothetical protein
VRVAEALHQRACADSCSSGHSGDGRAVEAIRGRGHRGIEHRQHLIVVRCDQSVSPLLALCVLPYCETRRQECPGRRGEEGGFIVPTGDGAPARAFGGGDRQTWGDSGLRGQRRELRDDATAAAGRRERGQDEGSSGRRERNAARSELDCRKYFRIQGPGTRDVCLPERGSDGHKMRLNQHRRTLFFCRRGQLHSWIFPVAFKTLDISMVPHLRYLQ